MSRFFGAEPTCGRCDYPRRLHHLLGVDHGYTPREEDGPGGAGTPTGTTENTPTNNQGDELMTNGTGRDPGHGMTFAEAVSDSVVAILLAKIGAELDASEDFPEKITLDELERFAAWSGETVGTIMAHAVDGIGAESSRYGAPCTECRRHDAEAAPLQPTHVAHIDKHAHLVTVTDPGVWEHVRDLGDGIDTGIETDRRIQGAGYTRTGCWQSITQHDGLEYQLAPIKPVTQ